MRNLLNQGVALSFPEDIVPYSAVRWTTPVAGLFAWLNLQCANEEVKIQVG